MSIPKQVPKQQTTTQTKPEPQKIRTPQQKPTQKTNTNTIKQQQTINTSTPKRKNQEQNTNYNFTSESEQKKSKQQEEEFLREDIESLREGIKQNIEVVKQSLASMWNYKIFGFTIVGFIGISILLTIGLPWVINILLALLVFLIIGAALFSRYALYQTSVNTAYNYVVGHSRLDKQKKFQKIFPYKTNIIPTPKEIYNTATELLPEEWKELLPLFEKQLQYEIKETEKNQKKSLFDKKN